MRAELRHPAFLRAEPLTEANAPKKVKGTRPSGGDYHPAMLASPFWSRAMVVQRQAYSYLRFATFSAVDLLFTATPVFASPQHMPMAPKANTRSKRSGTACHTKLCSV